MNTQKNSEQTLTISVIIKRLLYQFFRKMLQKTCEHKNKYNQWTDYQDRYYKDYCPDCQLTIYENML